MKAKSLIKREISILLVAVLLFSMWIFCAPVADATYSGGAGNYYVKVTCESDKATGGWNSNSWNIYGKNSNGTGSQATIATLSKTTEFTGTQTVWEGSTDKFPTYVTFDFDFGGGPMTWREMRMKMHVYAGSSSSSLTEVAYHSDWQTANSDSYTHAKGTKTITVGSGYYPKASSATGLSFTAGSSNEIASDSKTFSVSGPTSVTDQYGVQIASGHLKSVSYTVDSYKANNSAGSNLTNDLSISASQISKASSGYKAQGCNCHWLQIKYSGSFNGGTATTTASGSLYYKQLTATWNYYTNNSNGTSGTAASTTTPVYFGDTPTNTSLTNSYFDQNQHHTGGTFTTSRMTANASFTMGNYTNTNHNMTRYSQLTNDNINHKKSCTGCDYYVTEAHSYGSYHNINSSTHSRTCSKCNYVDTAAHSYGSWQIIPDPDTEHNHDGHSRDAEHFRQCSCGYIDYDNHKWQAQEAVPATCTTEGYTPYKCTECQMTTINLGENEAKPILGHNFGYDSTGTPTDTQHREKCSRCTATRWVDHPSYGAWYSKDGTNHAHKCTVCDKEITQPHGGASNANWSGWLNAKPGSEETGIRATVRANLDGYNPETHCFNYCTDCGYVKTQKHPTWNTQVDPEVTYPATCTTAGQKTEECAACGKVQVTPLPATGHSWSEEPISSGLDDARDGTGYLYFECQNCGSCCPAQYEYSEEIEDYTYVENEEIIVDNVEALEENEEALEQVPTPFFNDDRAAASFYNLDYSLRMASLRRDLGEDYQGLRFCGSVKIPAGVNAIIDPDADPSTVDNAVIDFGFVWTQTRFICDNYRCAHDIFGDPTNSTADPDKLVFTGNTVTGKPTAESGEVGYQVYQSSVVRNNAESGVMNSTASNWPGVTINERDTNTDNPSYYYSYNLVINTTKTVKANNWAKEYSARPYITYKYHGRTYTIYDGGASGGGGRETYSHRSVNSVANSIMRRDPTYDITDPCYYVNMLYAGANYEKYISQIEAVFRDKQYIYDKFYSDMTEEEFETYCYDEELGRDWWPSFILAEYVTTEEDYHL